jgi:hypothetical protein
MLHTWVLSRHDLAMCGVISTNAYKRPLTLDAERPSSPGDGNGSIRRRGAARMWPRK